MNRTVLKIASISIFFSLSCLFISAVTVEELHISKIFQNARAILIEDILQRDNKNSDFEKQYLRIDQSPFLFYCLLV